MIHIEASTQPVRLAREILNVQRLRLGEPSYLVLRTIYEQGVPMSSPQIRGHVALGRKHMDVVLHRLAQQNLIQRVSRGYYAIPDDVKN